MPLVAKPTPQRAIVEGLACQKAGKLPQAAQLYVSVIQEDPSNSDAWHLLGTIEIARRNFAAAHDLISKALLLKPDCAMYHHNLGFVLGALSRLPEAVASYRKAVDLAPDYAEALFNLAQMVQVKPEDPMVASVDRVLAMTDLSDQDRCFIEFAAGKIHANLGHYDRAFGHYAAGNEARKAKARETTGRAYLERILANAEPAMVTGASGDRRAGKTPVFIVGMPRSGTSLVEQVLASHPDVHGAGELPLIERICSTLPHRAPGRAPYPECLAAVPDDAIAALAESYLKHASAQAGGAWVITDKSPLNFRHLGLIARLFPDARIVHCRRDALDTCLSCYFQNFSNGQEYSFDLTDLGRFYCDYRWMMEQWAERLPIPVFDLEYEQLVGDLEGVGRQLLEFCGLDWHPDCSRFFETERPVLTASRAQVRRPVYTTSIGKWRHYETHLGPLIDALGTYARTGKA